MNLLKPRRQQHRFVIGNLMKDIVDENKSLEQLENDFWKDDSDYPTGLVEKCYRYREIALKELTIEQMRLLIGQNIGLKYLIPKALKILGTNILAEGDCYEGDLLSMVLNAEDNFWNENKNLRIAIKNLITGRRQEIESKNEENIHRQLLKQIDRFNEK